ncbi:hypothetical protein N5P37_011667 [Trichoderma harzianum]|nr:hypothetical protein N5P37_011667 [Trichoderma harzianum]
MPVLEPSDATVGRPKKPLPHSVYFLFMFALFCLSVGFIGGEVIQDRGLIAKWRNDYTNSPQCDSPSYRREWRSLSKDDKSAYLAAVKCLIASPSVTRSNGDLYNDFPFVHFQHAKNIHYTPLFLPYHRYFLHSFETKLKSVCGYNGSLTYWDWSLDWESLGTSPVFSKEYGFGGNGNPRVYSPSTESYCLTEGPFANLQLANHSSDEHTLDMHCLSRDFFGNNLTGILSGDGLQPAIIENILHQSDYQTFRNALEHGPHKEIPNGIGGDFITFAAPSDPLWYLHHSQLDRLWWLWQRADPTVRLWDYGGHSTKGQETLKASIKDIISISPLAPDVRVSDVMSTESDVLCYRYL